MKTIGKFMQSGFTFIVKVNKMESGSNYNQFCHVFKEGDKSPLAGTNFKDTDTKDYIMQWASKSLGRPDSIEFKQIMNIPLTAEEEYPELEVLAKEIAEKTLWHINRFTPDNTTCPYPRQCILEMVIAKLEKCV